MTVRCFLIGYVDTFGGELKSKIVFGDDSDLKEVSRVEILTKEQTNYKCRLCKKVFSLGEVVLVRSGARGVPEPSTVEFISEGDVVKLLNPPDHRETFVPIRHGQMIHARHSTPEAIELIKKASEDWNVAMDRHREASIALFGKY